MCIPIIGAIVTGISGAMSAMTAAAQSKGQAAMDRRQDLVQRATGAYQADRKTDEIQRMLGAARAGTGANGLDVSGSSFDIIDESAQEGALDVAAIRWNSRLQSDNLQYKAKLNDMNAKSQTIAAPLAFAAPVINSFAQYGNPFKKAA